MMLSLKLPRLLVWVALSEPLNVSWPPPTSVSLAPPAVEKVPPCPEVKRKLDRLTLPPAKAPSSPSVVLAVPLCEELLVPSSVKLSVAVSVLVLLPPPPVVLSEPSCSRKLSAPLPLSVVVPLPVCVVVPSCCCEKVPDSDS